MRRTILIPAGSCGPRRPRAGRLQCVREPRRRQESVARRVQDRLALAAHHAAQCRAAAAAARRAAAAGSDAGRPGQGSAVAGAGGASAAQPGHDRHRPGRRPHQRRGVAGAEGGRRQRRPQHPQPGQHRHQDHQRQRQDVHRQPDLLAGHAACRRGHRPDQGAAAHPRRPGRGPAAPRARRRPSSGASAACSKASSESGSDLAPPRSARRPDRGRRSRLAARSRAPSFSRSTGASPDVFTLPNGLQVVVLPSSRAPIVNQLVVYKVGSADEVYGKTGIAHFLEHMMFKGTGTVGAHRVLAHRLARTAGATTPTRASTPPATTRPSPPTGWRWSCAWRPTAWPTCASPRRS